MTIINIEFFFKEVDFKKRYDKSEIVVVHNYVIFKNESFIKIVCLNVNFNINKFIHTKKVYECQIKRDIYIDVIENIRI